MRFSILFIVVTLALGGCSTAPKGSVTLPLMPAWLHPSPATEFTAAEVGNHIRRLAPAAAVSYSDGRYTLISHSWLEAYMSWTWSAAKAAGVAYTPESFDCEDFALGFYFFATRAASKAGLQTAPMVARITVAQEASFANVPGRAGSRHALVAVATDRGIWVVEPQPDAGPFRLIRLEDYPNRILTVRLGD